HDAYALDPGQGRDVAQLVARRGLDVVLVGPHQRAGVRAAQRHGEGAGRRVPGLGRRRGVLVQGRHPSVGCVVRWDAPSRSVTGETDGTCGHGPGRGRGRAARRTWSWGGSRVLGATGCRTLPTMPRT